MERKAWRFTEDRQRERNAPTINGGRSAVADFAALKKTLSGSMTRPCTIAPTLTESIVASRDWFGHRRGRQHICVEENTDLKVFYPNGVEIGTAVTAARAMSYNPLLIFEDRR